jgi:glycine/D-amino acid oxidase-like deaminating enzyme
VSDRVVQEWAGIMGATSDGRPFVGEVPGKKGMWISAGFNGHGMVLCLKSAQALVQIIRSTGEKPDWFPESFLITAERLKKSSFKGRTDMQAH